MVPKSFIIFLYLVSFSCITALGGIKSIQRSKSIPIDSSRKTTISGKVTDSHHNPLEGTSVVLLHAADSSYVCGGIANNRGEFQLLVPSSGPFVLQLSSVGYIRRHFLLAPKGTEHLLPDRRFGKNLPVITLLGTSNQQMEDILLSEDTYLLSGVTVTTNKPQVEMSTSTTVVNLNSSIAGTQGTLFDALKRVPGVQMREDGTLLLNGQVGATVMINGKPSYLSGASLVSYLQAIPASSVGKIELVTLPSSQYDASGKSGIIKIEMSKNAIQGMIGSFFTGFQQQNVYGKGNVGGGVQYRKDRFNISLNYGFYKGVDLNSTTIFRDYTEYELQPVSPSYMFQYPERRYGYNHHYLRVAGEYEFSTRWSVGGYSTTTWTDRHNRAHLNSVFQSLSAQPDSILYTWNREKFNESNIQSGINLTYQSARDLQWNTTFDFQRYKASNAQNQHNIFENPLLNTLTPDTLSGKLNLDTYIYTTQSGIEVPFTDKIYFTGGVKAAWVRISNDMGYKNKESGLWVPDLRLSNEFSYHEDVYAGYAQVQGQVGDNHKFELGLRIEHTCVNSRMKEYSFASDSFYNNHYTNLFPFARWDFQWGKNTNLGVSYGSRIVRPNYRDLNPSVTMDDKYLYNQGNVSLKPEISHQLELTLMFMNRYRFVFFGAYTYHPITKSYEKTEGKRAWVRPLNLSSDYSYGVRFTGINLHPMPCWTIIANAVATYKNYSWVTEGVRQHNNLITPMLYIGNQFDLSHGWKSEVNGYLNGRTPLGQGTLQTLWSVSLGLSKSLFHDKGSIRLFADDALSSRYLHVEIDYLGMKGGYKERRFRNIGISFSYKFQKGEKVKDLRTEDRVIESKRITLY